MFSGLERQRVALYRHKSVAWAWVKARGILDSRPTPKNSMLMTSVLPVANSPAMDNDANWRDSLAAVTYRKLARQLCEQFYDLSIFHAWRSRTPESVAASRMLSPALPSYCRDAKADEGENGAAKQQRALILTSVLQSRKEQRGAVLISLRSKAA